MKGWKIYSIIITIVLIILIIGLGLYGFIFKENITEQEAKRIAFEYANVLESEVNISYINKNKEDVAYEIAFYDEIYEYEVKVNYNNGNVTNYEKDIRVYNNTENGDNIDNNDIDNNTTNTISDTTDNNTVTNSTDTNITNNVNNTNNGINTDNFIGEEKAKEISLTHAGLSNEDVFFKSVELDINRYISVYEIEFYYNNFEYDYKIDATTGEVLKYERDIR